MTFVIKLRGAPHRTAVADYECPVHGRFTETVDRDANGDPPAAIECTGCDKMAEYRISAPLCKVRLVEAVKGKHAKPDRPTYTNTDAIGDGQPVYDWLEDRAKVWERRRQEDVMKFAKEHHERPIGRT